MSAPDWSDSITILQARGGRRMAKTLLKKGTFLDYDDAYYYNIKTIALSGLDDLWRVLSDLVGKPRCCVVRGRLISGHEAYGVRRLAYPDKENSDAATLAETPRRWLVLDIDDVARPDHVPAHDLLACADVVLALLPEQFQRTECIVQASAGHGIKPGIRVRLWYWCDRPLSGAEITRWLKDYPVDPSVFRTVQPVYTARPIFAPGVTEHLPERLAMYPGEQWLQCPSPEELAPPIPKPRPEVAATPIQAEPYVRKALERAADNILSAGVGKRHPTLVAEASCLGRLVAVGLVAAADVRAVLKRAEENAGKDDADEVDAAISWGLDNPTDGALPENRYAA